MKILFSKFGIMILAFVFGITATAFWFYFNPKIESYEESNFSKIPTIKQLDLKNNPRKYDGKVVRLQTNLYWYQHGYFFADVNGYGEFENKRIAISAYEPKRDEIFNFLEKFHIPYERWQPVNVSVIGRFTYKITSGFSAGIEDRTPLHFEIFEIESAGR